VNQFTFTPKVDIWETEEEYYLAVEMPGVDENGVDVKLEDGILTILGRVQSETYSGFERTYAEYEIGNFEREFEVANVVDENKIQARIKNGILQLVLPKREAAKPKRIAVSVG
jgi:HSP20 family protein